MEKDVAKQKVYFVIPSFAGGGAERVVISYANSIDPDRYEATIVVGNATGPLISEVDSDIRIINLNSARMRKALLPLAKLLRRDRPRCVVSTMAYVNFCLAILRPVVSRRTSFIFREANTPNAAPAKNSRKVLYRILYRILYPRADLVICPSELIASTLKKITSLPEDLFWVLNNPVDVVRYREAAYTTRRQAGSGRRFVAAGRLSPQKGFSTLIDAMSELPEEDHLTIFGTGPLKEDLKQYAKDKGISSRVIFAGFEMNPWAWFAGADAFLLSSHWEGMPNVALEALACGTPVISTPEAGGIHELARQASEGAVTVAVAGTAFNDALRHVKERDIKEPHHSLLPLAYERDHAVATFQQALRHCTGF